MSCQAPRYTALEGGLLPMSWLLTPSLSVGLLRRGRCRVVYSWSGEQGMNAIPLAFIQVQKTW